MTPDYLKLVHSYVVHYRKDFPVQTISPMPCPNMSYFGIVCNVTCITVLL